MREYADFPFIWLLVVSSLTNHALYMGLEECFSLRTVYNLGVAYPRRAQINTCIYSVFRHTQNNYGSTENILGLFTGHHQTCTYINIQDRVYSRPHDLEKDISSFSQIHETGKTATEG